jgi:bifunctional non-homologous end joining protein LigD
VLKSWAVPKGPSLNPTDKRLAVMTEDHPLDYLDFEGVIPEGHYGAGPVMVWDIGAFQPEGKLSEAEQLARGELKFTLQGRRLRGGFALVKLKPRPATPKGNEWLLIKHRDEASDSSWDIESYDSSILTGRSLEEIQKGQPLPPAFAGELEGARRAPMPRRVEPMLATLLKEPFSDPEWLFELKWDGMRALARIEDGKLELWSRRGRSADAQYPELGVLPERVAAKQAILDGEIVVLDDDGRASFERLQSRMHAQRPSQALLESAPVTYYLFDILYCDGFDLRAVPLIERKQFLRRMLDQRPPLRYSDHVRGQGRELLDLAREKQVEGIVGKRMSSAYVEGRSTEWVKLKITQELDAVIGGVTAAQGGQVFGALLLGLYDQGRLRYIGRVGTGFTQKSQENIRSRLEESATCPFAEPRPAEKARWVKPLLAARVKFGAWTAESRLRAPVFLGLREDIDPLDCRVETEAPASAPVQPPPVATAPVLRRWDQVAAELERGQASNVVIELDGKNFRLSNLNKVYFPKEGYTKRDVLAYYYEVADRILPFLRRRPLVLRRTPDGITGEAFFQKDAGDDAPEWFETCPIRSEERGKESRFFIASDTADLLYLSNLGCIEHNAWSSPAEDLELPDYVFFDLDPVEGTPYSTVVSVARSIHEVLLRLGLKAFLKTSGATGFHMYLPLERIYSYEQIRTFAEIVARLVAERMPEQVTLERAVGKRPAGKIYIDYSQNGYGRPLTVVYSVRPFPGATVSAPVTPEELRPDLAPGQFTIKTLPARLNKVGDLWGRFWKSRQRLEKATERLGQELAR